MPVGSQPTAANKAVIIRLFDQVLNGGRRARDRVFVLERVER